MKAIKVKKWNNLQISFVAIFISISVIMLIIAVRLAPFTILPAFRQSIIGLPIKITGFIFGPIIGFLTGLLSDLVTFLFIPGVYSYWYTIYMAITGLIPGLFFWLFIKQGRHWFEKTSVIKRLEAKINYLKSNSLLIEDLWKKEQKNKKIKLYQTKLKKVNNWKNEKALINFYWITSTLILTIIMLSIILGVSFSDVDFSKFKLVKSKIGFIILILFGTSTMTVFLFVARFSNFFLKNDRYLTIVPIVAFSAVHEPITSLIAAKGDVQSGALVDFSTALLTHLITSPIKIWTNLSVIYFTARVIVPLVHKKISYNI